MRESSARTATDTRASSPAQSRHSCPLPPSSDRNSSLHVPGTHPDGLAGLLKASTVGTHPRCRVIVCPLPLAAAWEASESREGERGSPRRQPPQVNR